MLNMNFKNTIIYLLLGLFATTYVSANELTDRQYSASAAQKKYDLEKARYDDATARVDEQQQRVAQDQALLKERRQQQAAAKASMARARGQLDQEKRQLQKAWNTGRH